MAAQDIKTAYQTAKNDIANLIGFFECQLAKEPEKLNWGHVGTLETTRNWLIDSLSILSGFSEAEIKNTLDEARLDANTQTENSNP